MKKTFAAPERNIFTLFFAVLAFCFISCNTQKQIPYYLNNVVDTSRQQQVQLPDLKIQKNDILTIIIYSASTMPGRSDSLYNFPGGILVNAQGNMEYPRLGTIHAEGMTKDELSVEIKKRLAFPKKLLEEPEVIVHFSNFKITILGEVGRPGFIPVTNEHITILEAIGAAGDMSAYAKRDAVKIIREVNGVREIGLIDLTSPKLFTSAYYNLLQNDVVIVEPTSRHLKQSDLLLAQQRVSFAISLVSSAAIIYGIIKK